MKRILLIGSGGAGKSTLAQKLGEKLKLPVLHLDRMFWKPGWVEPDREKFKRDQLVWLKKKRWIIDGNYGGTQELRIKYADTVILLALSRWTCIARVLKRYLQHQGRSRPDMTPGCPERLDLEYLSWVWHYPKRGGKVALERVGKLRKNQKAVILRSPAEVERFLTSPLL
jgi:adenylate kinase family enzyme